MQNSLLKLKQLPDFVRELEIEFPGTTISSVLYIGGVLSVKNTQKSLSS